MSDVSLDIRPTELHFPLKLNTQSKQTLVLVNPHDRDTCFKVKTTAPKRYCVRPNAARIPARGQIEIEVLLQALEQFPDEKECRDKFLVQSAWLDTPSTGSAEAETQLVTQHWSSLATKEESRKRREQAGENVGPKGFNERKLKAYLLQPGSAKASAPAAFSQSAISTPTRAPAGAGDGELAKQVQELKSANSALEAQLQKGGGGQKLELMYAVMLALLAFVLGYFL